MLKYQRVSKSDKVEGRMSHNLRLQMKRWAQRGNFQIPTSGEHNARHQQVMGEVRRDVLGMWCRTKGAESGFELVDG